MTNGEKYKDEIVKHIKDDSLSIEDNSYCDFIKSKILLYYGLKCKGINCHDCTTIQSLWLNEECEESSVVDWTQVAIDTPILVKDRAMDNWQKRYFAGYEDGMIVAYNDGTTSWSANNSRTKWEQGKLVDETE